MENRSRNFLQIKKSKFGRGLFANQNIPPAYLICKIEGPVLSFQEMVALKDKESHTLQIDFDKYIYCNIPFLFSNHSCNPNCGITPDLEMISLREISKGEELLWDYSTSMLERHWTMPCHCGVKECRQIITDFDLLPPYRQDLYLQQNIVLPFIVRFLQQRYAKTA